MEQKQNNKRLLILYTVTVSVCLSVIITLAVILAIVLNAKNQQENLNSEQKILALYEQVRPNIIEIKAGSEYGTGFVAAYDDQSLTVITNYHLANIPLDSLGIRFFNQKSFILDCAQILGYSEFYDFCVLEIAIEDAPDLQFLSLIENVKPYDAIKAGESIVALGNALSNGISVSSGLISKLDSLILQPSQSHHKPMLQVGAALNSGMSGGPLFNLDGRLLGINTLRVNGTDVDNIGYCLPDSVFYPLYRLAVSDSHIKGNELPIIDIYYSVDSFKNVTVNIIDAGFTMNFGDNGLFVQSVHSSNSPMLPNDKILAIGGLSDLNNISCSALSGELLSYSASGIGKPLKIILERNGQVQTATFNNLKSFIS